MIFITFVADELKTMDVRDFIYFEALSKM